MEDDTRRMRRALTLAARGAGRTSPNPMVGAVMVRDDEVIGEGHHRAAGSPHAEVEALRRAGEAARGATLYVTLEPCAHHGRTPPCTEAIIAAGVSRVVAAMRDPDPRVDGRGIAALRAAGVTVDVGTLGPDAERLNEAFVTRVRLGRPFVVLKLATTLDGRVAVPGRRYLVGEPALAVVHRLRARSDAVLVGIGTVLADDPRLTVRAARGRNPLRVIVDTDARTPANSNVVRCADPKHTLILVGEGADRARTAALTSAGVDILPLPGSDNGHLDLGAALSCLAERGVNSVLCEGGPTIGTALLRLGLVQRLLLLFAPFVGGAGPRAFGELGSVVAVERISSRRLGDDIAVSVDLRGAG